MHSSPYILIAEDDVGQAEVLRYTLKEAGFKVSAVHNGQDALESINEDPPDLLILDWMMPILSGIMVLDRLRDNPTTNRLPVIMLTARGEEADKMQSFKSGTDDYVIKPYLPNELIARIKAMLQRMRPDLMQPQLKCGDITLDIEKRRVARGDTIVELGPTEFRLLQVFMAHPGKAFSREQLLDKAWGKDIFVEDRTVDVSVRRLRKALNAGGREDLFRTVRGYGYSLEDT